MCSDMLVSGGSGNSKRADMRRRRFLMIRVVRVEAESMVTSGDRTGSTSAIFIHTRRCSRLPVSFSGFSSDDGDTSTSSGIVLRPLCTLSLRKPLVRGGMSSISLSCEYRSESLGVPKPSALPHHQPAIPTKSSHSPSFDYQIYQDPMAQCQAFVIGVKRL